MKKEFPDEVNLLLRMTSQDEKERPSTKDILKEKFLKNILKEQTKEKKNLKRRSQDKELEEMKKLLIEKDLRIRELEDDLKRMRVILRGEEEEKKKM